MINVFNKSVFIYVIIPYNNQQKIFVICCDIYESLFLKVLFPVILILLVLILFK